jgi:hypothetical protein
VPNLTRDGSAMGRLLAANGFGGDADLADTAEVDDDDD